MAIRGVIFDLGWTLLDFEGDISATVPQRAADVQEFLRANGFDLNGTDVFTDYLKEAGALWQAAGALEYEYPARLAMLRALRRHLKREDAARLAHGALAASFACIVPRWRPYADTFSVLNALRDADYRLGCISNTNDGGHVQHLVDMYRLRTWLDPVYTSEEIGLRKPHPGIFDMLLSEWSLPPQEVVMVGDTLNADVLGAHNAGMRGIWLDRGLVNPWSNNEESIGIITPDAVIHRLEELPALLGQFR